MRHVLTHAAGVPAVPADTTPEDLVDAERMAAVLADTEPWWEPGTKVGYHPQTFGLLVDQIVRRATGTPTWRVLAEEVAAPLGIAGELFFGVPASELGRPAVLEEAEGNVEMRASMPDDAPILAVVPRAVQPTAAFCNRAEVLTSDALGATMCARAVARMYARCWARWTASACSRPNDCGRSPPSRSTASTR